MTSADALARTQAVLAAHDLPTGLLPASLVEAWFDEATGSFRVRLPAEVRATFGGYRIAYAVEVTGRLEPGVVHDLVGVTAKRGPVWFGVRRITRDGDELVFAVGPVKRRLPVDAFDA